MWTKELLEIRIPLGVDSGDDVVRIAPVENEGGYFLQLIQEVAQVITEASEEEELGEGNRFFTTRMSNGHNNKTSRL